LRKVFDEIGRKGLIEKENSRDKICWKRNLGRFQRSYLDWKKLDCDKTSILNFGKKRKLNFKTKLEKIKLVERCGI